MAPAPPASASEIRGPLFRNVKYFAAVPVLLAGTACYQYRTSGRDAVQPGQVVHIDLTAPGAAALAPAIGPNATALNGKVLTRAGNDLTLAVTQIDRGSAPEQFLRGEPISLSFDNVLGIRMRRFDTPALRSVFPSAATISRRRSSRPRRSDTCGCDSSSTMTTSFDAGPSASRRHRGARSTSTSCTSRRRRRTQRHC